MINYRGVV